MGDPILQARGVCKRFGGVQAVDDMSIDVAAGEIVGLIGPNGAGKSTFFDCLSGFVRKDRGEVTFDGGDISRTARFKIARAGLVRTFQGAAALPGMTVKENLMLAAPDQPGESLLRAVVGSAARDAEVAEEADLRMETFGLTALSDSPAGDLSGGQKKLLDLARALMARPRALLLDEPLAGVNPSLRRDIMDRIRGMADEGIAVLIVEHDMTAVFRHCDRVVVMADGKHLVDGTPDEVQSDPRVREAYLGT